MRFARNYGAPSYTRFRSVVMISLKPGPASRERVSYAKAVIYMRPRPLRVVDVVVCSRRLFENSFPRLASVEFTTVFRVSSAVIGKNDKNGINYGTRQSHDGFLRRPNDKCVRGVSAASRCSNKNAQN